MASSITSEWRGTSDHNVTETAFDAVKCKLSAVTLGYFQDPFLRFFVDKPTRRIPLIHRGYYLRHVAIARCVELFLSQYATSSQVNIVSLGAGFDTLFFRLLDQRQFSSTLSFTEVDCDAIVDAKTKLLNDEHVRAGLATCLLPRYRTAADHARFFLALGHWQNCRILDMNGVFKACTTAEEKRRLASQEPFDEFADWMLCNAHYAIYLADNQDQDWTAGFEPAIIRSFQHEDLAAVRSLFESTHLEFAKGSRAVRQFVANRLRGDMLDVHHAFQTPKGTEILTSEFWVAEVDGEVVGCIGVKPLDTASTTQEDQHIAELCRLSVASTVRRRGLASALVRAVETFTASCGAFNEIRLETIGAMEGAQQLYRSLGYVEQVESEKQHSSFKLVRFQKRL
ncbi:uncharacterized protein PITG_11234 [Phytophthora infestans T30-4]|uniref:[phosphatase 2A protein]-leucine-carboxy methyltransferase n=1 Tax=Phytophthora infestans (strain T30-4) TaxID=403677 RepID=D0NGI2_PHYIT|nr:uncharacterized protein PITG_11234 [Phytophthora infestans T30-4]EEY57383.1 conserved hypothetical protein [Phytophthora infestans T30-4]|eukprot:XP_002901993.1 conserved hypothetical protein [Phytophthora infestans T30-4]